MALPVSLQKMMGIEGIQGIQKESRIRTRNRRYSYPCSATRLQISQCKMMAKRLIVVEGINAWSQKSIEKVEGIQGIF
jgi:hypothetical protein